jgi:hypothetical protein
MRRTHWLAWSIDAISQMQGAKMTQCKHRWEPSNFGIKYRTPNHYIYECARCGKSIFATLKEKQNGH